MPVIVLGEYLYGIHQSRFHARHQRWLDAHLSLFELLAVGKETARRYNDAWIAALAREHRLGIVTRDVHFQAVRGLHLSW